MARTICEVVFGCKYSQLTREQLAQFRRYTRRASYRKRHEANKKRQRDAKRQRKLDLIAALHRLPKCQRCGYDKCLAALEFHHIDQADMVFRIGGSGVSFAALLAEAEKCRILCRNCHREVHDGELGLGGRPASAADPLFELFLRAQRDQYMRHNTVVKALADGCWKD